jgi:hypothetical protein
MILIPPEFRNEPQVIPIWLSRTRLVMLDKFSVEFENHLIPKRRAVVIGAANLKLVRAVVTRLHLGKSGLVAWFQLRKVRLRRAPSAVSMLLHEWPLS